jgi:hypothetical protein
MFEDVAQVSRLKMRMLRGELAPELKLDNLPRDHRIAPCEDFGISS